MIQIFVLAFCVIVFIAGCIIHYTCVSKWKTISFDLYQSLNLVDLPIITVMNNGRRYNLLVDTGANWSYIDSREVDNLFGEKLDEKRTTLTAGGQNMQSNAVHLVSFVYKGFILSHNFIENDFSGTFNAIKEETGVSINGIIGTDFLTKYNGIINFEELKVTLKINDKDRNAKQ